MHEGVDGSKIVGDVRYSEKDLLELMRGSRGSRRRQRGQPDVVM